MCFRVCCSSDDPRAFLDGERCRQLRGGVLCWMDMKGRRISLTNHEQFWNPAPFLGDTGPCFRGGQAAPCSEGADGADPCEVKNFVGHICLRIPEQDRHFWSPRLTLTLEATEDGRTRIKGIDDPNANVWSLFLCGYLLGGTFGLFSGICGSVQWSLKQAPCRTLARCRGSRWGSTCSPSSGRNPGCSRPFGCIRFTRPRWAARWRSS